MGAALTGTKGTNLLGQVPVIGAGQARRIRREVAGGIGAVMGDKRLKAIAVRGSNDVHVARPAEFIGMCNEVMEYIKIRNDNPIPGVMPAQRSRLAVPALSSST